MKKFTIVNKGNRTAEILFYGNIYFYGKNSSENLSTKLRELDNENDNIIIRMNSGGGDVIEASAIYSTIKSLKAHVTIIVEGIAASAASFILLAANKVQISKAGRIMIHKFSGGAYGNSVALRELADMMESWEKDWIEIYAAKMGLTIEAVTSEYFQPNKDSWISPADAVKLKLADERVDGVVKQTPKDIENFSPSNAQAYYQNQILNHNTKSMNKEQLAAIGLAENATEAEINARLKVLADNEAASKEVAAKEAKEKTDKEAAAIENSKNPEFAAMAAKVERLDNEEREKMIQAAIDSKKIVATAKAEWENVGKTLGNEQLKKMLDNLSGAALPTNVIDQQSPKVDGDYKTFEELMNEGTNVAEQFQAKHPEKFNALWKAHYGSDYTESK